ncbi:MAG: DMT family transporter [Candidatus Tectomicrobia bacterium]|uniref:DMT family transporter n=1 Tax=Tectimicrobiota bacterium TaxID=2528274 RepID=A0A932HZB1_UNCTE|nr:DMT family transporter [Candidatus Tectomicrobia bacterium]
MGDLSLPSPEVRALIGSFLFACNQIVVRRLMDRDSAMTVTFWVNGWMGVFAIALSPFVDSYEGRPLFAILMFLGVGMVGQGMARYCSYRSNYEVGVSRTNAMIAASPLGAVVAGIVLLGERPGPVLWLGVGLVVAGMILLTSEGDGRRRAMGRYAFAFMSLVSFAITPYLRKAGLLAMNAPWMGILLSTSMANISLMTSSGFMAKPQRFRWDAAAMWAALPAGALAIGQAINFWTALRDGSLSVIAPLMRTGPIFVLLLSFLFLRGREVITKRVVIATLIVVAGAVLVTSGR